MNVSLPELQAIADHAAKTVCDQYIHARSLCVQQKDLPGIWPRMYLYADMSWHVGYEPDPNLTLIAQRDAEDTNGRDLCENLIIELEANGHVLVRPAPVPKSPAPAPVLHPAKETHEHPAAEAVAAERTPHSRTKHRSLATGKTVDPGQAVPVPRKRTKRVKAAW